MAQSVPVIGDNGPPSAVRVAVVRAYATASKDSNCDSAFDVEISTYVSTVADCTAYTLFDIGAGVLVKGLSFNTATSWSDDTTAGDVWLGDCDGADTLSGGTTVGAFVCATTNDTNDLTPIPSTDFLGKMYQAAASITGTWIADSAGFAATGLTTFYLFYSTPDAVYAPSTDFATS